MARSAISTVLAPVHRAGWPFIAGAFVLAIVLGFIWSPLFWLGLLGTIWCALFFRDPERATPDDPSWVVSPADGVVVRVGDRVAPAEVELGDRPVPSISVFLNIFDVHVNRTPVAGRVVRRAYHPGKFVNAALDKASDDNERQVWTIETADNRRVGLVQIAGLVARRIVSFEAEGAVLAPGQRVGLIRFGSRCDVFLPPGTAVRVIEGQRAVAGETILARLTGAQEPVTGRVA